MKGSFCSFIFFSKKNNFILTNDEEKSSIYGIQYIINILKKRNKFFFLIYGGEPTSKKILGDNIKISRRGSYNFLLIFNGKQKHCAYIGKNVINFIFNKFLKIKNKIINKNDIFEINNLTSISSGTNITPINVLLTLIIDFFFIKI